MGKMVQDTALSESQREDVVAALTEKAVEEVRYIAEFVGETNESKTIDALINKGMSQQVNDQTTAFNQVFNSMKTIIPPYDPLKLALLLEQNTRLNRACAVRARNTLGIGWSIVPQYRDEDEDKVDPEMVKAEKKRVKPLFENPNKSLPFTEVAYQVKFDEEATGNGYMEVSRNGKGEVDGMYHVPSHTVRVLRNNTGFVQIRGPIELGYVNQARSVFFKHFGESKVMNKSTGQFETGPISKDDQANELIQFSIYSPRSSFYGIPRWISAVAAIQGSRLAAVRNIAFFENDAVGRLAIIVSGGQLSDKSIDGIKNFLRADAKGPEKAHRVMVLQAEPRKVLGSRTGASTKIEIQPLTVGVTDDGSFLSYRKANDEEIRESSGLSTPFFTAEGINRSTSSVLRRITIEQELIPDISKHEWILNATVMASFKVKSVMLKFLPPKVLDDVEEATVQNLLQKSGVATINESRIAMGLPPFPPEMVYGKLPLVFALSFLDMGLAAQGMVTPAGVQPWVPQPATDDESQFLVDPNREDQSEDDDDDTEDDDESAEEDDKKESKSSISHKISKARRELIKSLTGVALKTRTFLKEELGRDVEGAEIILSDRHGTEIDRVSLDTAIKTK